MRETPRLANGFDLPCQAPVKTPAVLPLRADGGVDLPVREKRLNPVGFEGRVIRLLRSTLLQLVREFVTGLDVQRGVNQVDTISIGSPA